MPNYTFNCSDCGDFTEWHASSKGNKEFSVCPSCNIKSKRVFTPPIIYRVDQRVKDIEAAGRQPRTMKKSDMPAPMRRNPISTRPWQV